jgi:hypothetical protein
MPVDTLNAFEQQFVAHLRTLRGQPVVLDADLAWFLGIAPTKILKAIAQHPELFPPDFVFHLTAEEMAELEKTSPCMTASGISAGQPRVAFTTHGVGMLLLAFRNKKFALAAIPVLQAIAKFWKAEERVSKAKPLVNRNS